MKNIFATPYLQTAEQRLQNRLLSRKANRDKSDNLKLSPDQKRELRTLDPCDKLYYLRNLETSNIDIVT